MLFSDFTLGFDRSSVKIPILVGKHQDFDTLWYYDIGAKITMAMISNSICPMIGPATEPVVKKILRFILDRWFKFHLRKINNLEKKPEDAKAGGEEEQAEQLDKEENEGGDEKPTEEPPGEDECETKHLF
jgi:hypothetical protein